jgi:hypothetical protein
LSAIQTSLAIAQLAISQKKCWKYLTFYRFFSFFIIGPLTTIVLTSILSLGDVSLYGLGNAVWKAPGEIYHSLSLVIHHR